MDPLALLVISTFYYGHIWLLVLVFGFLFTLGTSTRVKIFVLGGIVVIFPFAVAGHHLIRMIPHEFKRAQTAWLKATCKAAITSPLAKSPATRINAEGILLNTNYDELMNSQANHPIDRADGGGRTFDEKAFNLLTQKKLSYVEIEMAPEGGGLYSNMGLLNTSGWSGKRYRRYYLAPANHVHCAYSRNPASSSGSSMAIHTESNRVNPRENDLPFCMSMELTDKPISSYHVTADRQWKLYYTPFTVAGISLPAWSVIHWDLIRLGDLKTGEEIAQYRGFEHPNTGHPEHQCNNQTVAENIMSAGFIFDRNRDFFRSSQWYQGSEVQRFYEPEKNSENASEGHPASGACPAGKPAITNPSIVADKLDDHSIYGGKKLYSENAMGGSQFASLFRLTADTRVSLIEWSGMMNGAGATEKFLVRIFSGDDLPEQLAYESEVTANVKSISKNLPKMIHVFSFKPDKLALPAGNYWISILSPGFFWAQEVAESPSITCGSGSATRRSELSNWTTISRDKSEPQPAVSARGFSFRLSANPGSR